MDKRAIKPDIISNSAVISTYKKGKQWGKGYRINVYVEPNVISYISATIQLSKPALIYERDPAGVKTDGRAAQTNKQTNSILPNFLDQKRPGWDLHAAACILLDDSLLTMIHTEHYLSPWIGDVGVMTQQRVVEVAPRGPFYQKWYHNSYTTQWKKIRAWSALDI
jgi:hypothetical protein